MGCQSKVSTRLFKVFRLFIWITGCQTLVSKTVSKVWSICGGIMGYLTSNKQTSFKSLFNVSLDNGLPYNNKQNSSNSIVDVFYYNGLPEYSEQPEYYKFLLNVFFGDNGVHNYSKTYIILNVFSMLLRIMGCKTKANLSVLNFFSRFPFCS